MVVPLQRSGRSLLLAFVAVVASFVAATMYSQYTTAHIRDDALTLAYDAAPSITHLAAARAQLSAVRSMAAQLVAAPTDRERIAALAAARSALARQLQAYFALPTSGEDVRSGTSVREAMTHMDEALAHLTRPPAATMGAPTPPTLAEVDRAMAHVASAMLDAIELDAGRTAVLAVRIEAARVRAMRIAFALDLVAIVLAIGAAWLSLRTVHGSLVMLEAHSKQHEERAAELEMFAGRVAHDIRGPLSAALLSVEMPLRGEGLNERHRTTLERGRAALQRAARILDGLLGFARAGARPQAGARAEVRAVIDDVTAGLRPSAEAERVELLVEGDGNFAVACDPGILTSIVSNLVQNAIKYMGEAEARRVTVRAATRGAWVRLEVTDTGPGLPAGSAGRVFEPYVRAGDREQPGIGLGLATVRRTSEAHGGRAGVDIVAERGCTFWVELPPAR